MLNGIKFRWIFILIFVGVLVFQLQIIWHDFVIPLGNRIWSIRSFNAVERSGILHEGYEFAMYMDFLQETIPAEAKVILPPHSSYQTLSNFGFADYFLMPRELHNCGTEVESCVLRMTGELSYIITAGKFPPPEIARQVKRFIPFQGTLGVWAPK